MASLRERAACIGVTGNFSVMHDFFGHMTEISGVAINTQIDRLAFKRIDINAIRVGSDQFTAADLAELDIAVRDTRNFYAPVQLAVGRVHHWIITTADAAGYEDIGSDDEAVDLCDDWSVANNALDVFFVLTYAGTTIGLSAVEGPCDKDDSKDMEGSVVAIEGATTTTGFVLAHEVGHYLGLSHTPSAGGNLMFPTVPNGGGLSSGQGTNMRDHCFVKSGC